MTENKIVKILIIDDHPLFRENAKAIINQHPTFKVIGEAGDAREAERLAVRLKPDLAVMDLSLPDKSGIQLTKILSSLLPEIMIVIVSMHSKIDYIINAFRGGAKGYIVKESVARLLIDSLEAALRGEYYLDPALSQGVVGKLLETPNLQSNTDSAYGTLTPREQEIIRLVAQGITTKDISEKLFISAKTVTNHRANIMSKLDLHNTAELIRYAAKLGLLADII